LRDGDRVFGVAQRQGFDAYGAGANSFEIIKLDETSYEEQHCAEISGRFRDGVNGIHHVHANGTVTVFILYDMRLFRIAPSFGVDQGVGPCHLGAGDGANHRDPLRMR
jgi:hypothetical protein